MNEQSLRDQKKKATALTLANAAFELALENGLDGFIVEDIVKKAGYSRRTFTNYFSCKEEAVVTAGITIKNEHEAEELIRDLPEGSTPLDIMYRLMKMHLTTDLLWKLRKLIALSKQYPTLEPYILSALHRTQAEIQIVLNDLTRNSYSKEYLHLLSGAVYGTMLPLIEGKLEVLLPGETENKSDCVMTFDKYLDSTFHYLRNGF